MCLIDDQDCPTERQTQCPPCVRLKEGGVGYHDYLHMYTHTMPAAVRQYVDDNGNCEDIAMQFLVANTSTLPPVYVRGRLRNIYITSFGRNVSPEWVECALHGATVRGLPGLAAARQPVLQHADAADHAVSADGPFREPRAARAPGVHAVGAGAPLQRRQPATVQADRGDGEGLQGRRERAGRLSAVRA